MRGLQLQQALDEKHDVTRGCSQAGRLPLILINNRDARTKSVVSVGISPRSTERRLNRLPVFDLDQDWRPGILE
jgi:hypothetical protein